MFKSQWLLSLLRISCLLHSVPEACSAPTLAPCTSLLVAVCISGLAGSADMLKVGGGLALCT